MTKHRQKLIRAIVNLLDLNGYHIRRSRLNYTIRVLNEIYNDLMLINKYIEEYNNYYLDMLDSYTISKPPNNISFVDFTITVEYYRFRCRETYNYKIFVYGLLAKKKSPYIKQDLEERIQYLKDEADFCVSKGLTFFNI